MAGFTSFSGCGAVLSINPDELGAFSDFAYGLNGVEVSAVPEPSMVLLLATGLGVLALGARRRGKKG